MCIGAYAAGIMDGDGSIQIQDKRSSGSGHRMIVYLSGCDDRPHQVLRERWGGATTCSTTRTGRPYFRWHLLSSNAVKFLKDILPYLLVKKEQAELAIVFQSEGADWAGDHAMMSRMRVLSKRGNPNG